MKKVAFRELTLPVQVAVVAAWVYLVCFVLAFVYGFFTGLGTI